VSKQYKSCAEWDSDIYAGMNRRNISIDSHYSRRAARAVCNSLENEGFGGDGILFPLRTWTEGANDPVETFHVIGDHPVGRRPDKVFKSLCEDAYSAAVMYARELKKAGYENVKVEQIS